MKYKQTSFIEQESLAVQGALHRTKFFRHFALTGVRRSPGTAGDKLYFPETDFIYTVYPINYEDRARTHAPPDGGGA